MAKLVCEVLSDVDKQRAKSDKVKILRENESWALKDIIRGSMDSSLKWNLPPGKPPYNPSPEHSHPANLLREHKKFGYFVKGGKGDKMSAVKRESMFIGLIEGVHPGDAELVIGMINKEKPKGLTRPIVEEAFPGLLKD
jgi:hypothetical protein